MHFTWRGAFSASRCADAYSLAQSRRWEHQTNAVRESWHGEIYLSTEEKKPKLHAKDLG